VGKFASSDRPVVPEGLLAIAQQFTAG